MKTGLSRHLMPPFWAAHWQKIPTPSDLFKGGGASAEPGGTGFTCPALATPPTHRGSCITWSEFRYFPRLCSSGRQTQPTEGQGGVLRLHRLCGENWSLAHLQELTAEGRGRKGKEPEPISPSLQVHRLQPHLLYTDNYQGFIRIFTENCSVAK